MKYTPIIGLEVHVELKTASKMFCSCTADYFGQAPNTHTCPVCLGLPGALPVPNHQAIAWCIKIAMALNCNIAEFSKFDRKNYFYPDLAKGYQISQYDLPFGEHGYMKLTSGKTIGITRVHMEEDTGKLTHEGDTSLIDFNRSGVPLVEIVTEPDFDNATDVKEYLQKLQQIVRYLDVSDADMEKGNMRLEPNISLQSADEKKHNQLPKYKVEVKNINSFRFVEKAITFEVKRQQAILEKGERPVQETRGWNENKQRTFSQRVKEEANDYRYFPEPDIPPIRTKKADLDAIRATLPELPSEKQTRFVKAFSLSEYDAEILTREKATATFFEAAVVEGKKQAVSPKQIANYIINKKPPISQLTPRTLITQIKQASTTVIVDENKLQQSITEVIAQNEKAVTEYKAGKEPVIMFLVGMVMRKLGTKADAQLVKTKLQQSLKSN
jgi:aspartyl-tRNA(Asn)/glutamyl-tRNA(Gln) amidotransferase subunit B